MSRLQTLDPLSFVFPIAVFCQGHNNGSFRLFYFSISRPVSMPGRTDRLNAVKLREVGKTYNFCSNAGDVLSTV